MIGARAVGLTCAAIGVCLGLAGCTIEDTIVREIGTAVPQLADSDLRTQPVTADASAHTMQVAEWTITRADLDFDGVVTDLTFGQPCKYIDTALVVPVGLGPCASGVVVGSEPQARPASLALTFTLQVRRAQPLDLPPGGDFDGDGVANASDNCVLIDNPDQTPSPGEEFGSACSVRDSFSGATLLDSDRDRVADFADNCPQIPNADQKDTAGIGATGIRDGIGDACVEQVAQVRLAGNALILQDLGPEALLQQQYRVTFLTVDFKGQTGMDCDWSAGTCELDPSAIEFCPQNSSLGLCL